MQHPEARAGRPAVLSLARLFLGIGAAGLLLAAAAARATGDAAAVAPDTGPPYAFINLANPLSAVAFAADGRHGLAVGDAGAVLRSADGGKSWQRVEGVPVKTALHAVALAADGSRGFAVGEYGVALRTVDAGQTWQSVHPQSIGALRSVAVSPDGLRAWFAGEFGTLSYTLDGGETWKAANGPYLDDTLECVAFAADGVHGWAVGQNGLLLRSVDGGINWKRVAGISRSEYLQSVVFAADGVHGWTVGDYGAIYRSADGGASWSKVDGVPTDVFLNGVFFTADGRHGWAAGDTGTVLRSVDAGLTWETAAGMPTTQDNYAIGFAADGLHGWVTGAYGRILTSDDAGLTWQVSGGSPTEWALDAITFAPDALHGWAVGGDGTVLRSADGGLTWQRGAGVPPIGEIESVAFAADGRRGWAVGVNATVLRTTDGGEHWEQVSGSPKGAILRAVAFAADGLRGWAAGAEGTLMNTTDGGRTWQRHAGVPTGKDLNAIAFAPDGNRGWAAGDAGVILRTLNGGQTWKQVAGILTQHKLTSITCVGDGTRVWASGENQTFLRSVDAGETWMTVNDGAGQTTASVAFAADGRRGWSVGGEGYVMRSVDGGDFWFYVAHEPQEGVLHSVAVSADGRHVWAAGDNGTLLRTSSSEPDARPFQGRVAARLETHDGVIHPVVAIEGLHGPPAMVWVHISLSGSRATGDLARAFSRTFSYGQPVPGWKRDDLGPGVYTCLVEVSDGWNIVTQELQFGNGPWARFAGFMGWDIALAQPLAFAKEHGSQNLGLLLALYVLAVAGLFVFRPSLFVLWHEKAAPLIAALPIPGKATDKVTQLAGLFLISRPRALDAVVREFAPVALAEMEKLPEAAARTRWVAAPLQVEDELFGRTSSPYAEPGAVPGSELYVRGLTELKRHLVARRWWLSVEGPGGVGKSALAFQVARWFAAPEAPSRLHLAQAIPICLRSLKEGLDKEVLAELRRILELPRMSAQLAEALLSQRRVLVLVDGVSEKAADLEALALGPLNPSKGAALTHLVVMTSRRRIQMPEVVKVLPQPVDLGTIDEVLSRYLDDVVGAGRFSPVQREAIREALKGIMKEMSRDNGHPPQIPMVFVKLIIQRADEVLAKDDAAETQDGAEAALPRDLAGLVDAYLSSLLEARPDAVEEADQARRAALACVGADGIPKARPMAAYALRSLNHEALEGLVTTGLMLRDGADVGDPLYKFALDPIAEYLAAKELVLAVRDGRLTLAQLKHDAAQFAAGSDVPAKMAQVARALGVTVD